jgi:hypothetical protein
MYERPHRCNQIRQLLRELGAEDLIIFKAKNTIIQLRKPRTNYSVGRPTILTLQTIYTLTNRYLCRTYISFPCPCGNDSNALVFLIYPFGCNLQFVLHPKYIMSGPIRPRLWLPKYPNKLGGRNDAPKSRGVTLNVRTRVRCASESGSWRGRGEKLTGY